MSRRIGIFLGIAALQAALTGASWAQDKKPSGQKAAGASASATPARPPKPVSQKAARAKKPIKVFRLKDGSTITGTKSASSGDKTQIKTIDGTSRIVSTADIVSVTDAPPEVQAKAAAKAKRAGKATSKADAKAEADRAAKEAEERKFKEFESFASKPVPRTADASQ